MPIPQVNDRIREAPAVVLRAVFAGVGQLLLAADKVRARAGQAWPADRGAAKGQSRPQSRWHSLNEARTATAPQAGSTTAPQAAGTATAPQDGGATAAQGGTTPRTPRRRGRAGSASMSAASATSAAAGIDNGAPSSGPATPVAGRRTTPSSGRGARTAGRATTRGAGARGTTRRTAAKPAAAADPARPAASRAKPAPTKAEPTATPAKPTVPAGVARPARTADPSAAGTGTEVPPLPGYDELTFASIRARMRGLDAAALRALVTYEQGHARRAEVIAMLERRLAKITAG